ncbi:hypothetical protein PUR29_35110 [Methylobacterium ajmalii]|uniref:Uncharacterized protein n=1 Tax=Methylobacterium ajmalii TaxID=2738439 RepID=A0ABV0A4A5_9HYPH
MAFAPERRLSLRGQIGIALFLLGQVALFVVCLLNLLQSRCGG